VNTPEGSSVEAQTPSQAPIATSESTSE
jgi:hypothetical protein